MTDTPIQHVDVEPIVYEIDIEALGTQGKPGPPGRPGRDSSQHVLEGEMDPEGHVMAIPGSLYLHLAGRVYLKRSGVGATGWFELRPIYVGPDEPTDTGLVWIDTS